MCTLRPLLPSGSRVCLPSPLQPSRTARKAAAHEWLVMSGGVGHPCAHGQDDAQTTSSACRLTADTADKAAVDAAVTPQANRICMPISGQRHSERCGACAHG
eukprot:364360-Chlamydomonas_euryale.AAC.7